jgi:lipopolysaccharide/colanic/teichoic acid biosynthesis glycosyltransferase
MQRFFDIIFSLLALFFLCPLLLPILIVLKLTGEGEIFFSQPRVGKDGEMFDLLKFATMLKDSPNMGTGTVTVQGDPRILPMGHFLRKTKLNELPQLLNVFLGHMSVIGPRPQDRRCFDAFPVNSQKEIVRVRPGLSGIGSIVFRDEENLMVDSADYDNYYDNVIMPYKGFLEEWYVRNNGLFIYFLCIFITVWILFRPKSSLLWKVLKDLPKPPAQLSGKLGQ